jgi:hypothetical protein
MEKLVSNQYLLVHALPQDYHDTDDASARELNQATQHWYTGSTHKRVISVRPGHRVYESHVG